MSRRIAWTLPVAALGVALAIPGAAMAATRPVFMGLPPASQKSFEKASSDANAFFPSSIRIHAGDVVAFQPVGFHTVDMPARGGPLPLVGPTGRKVAAADAAGIPFWFNARDELGFDKRLLKQSFGRTLVKGPGYRIQSGLPLGRKLKPLRVRFDKAGLYTYYCNIHAGMKGTVRVVGKHSPIPSAASDTARVKAQVAKALAAAKALPAATKPPANTISLGAQGKGGASYFGMLPDKLTVPAGATVKFAMPVGSTEVHTATFGPGNPDKPAEYLGAIASTLQGAVFDGRAVYPSEPPGTPPAGLSPTLHGNGFWNSGFLDAVPASPLAASSAVTFTTPGTYQFVCLIHTFMKGTITVQ
jgi:plastocyanin